MDGVYSSAVKDFLSGVHKAGDVYKIALYREPPEGDTYDETQEITGPGYLKGGKVLTGYNVGVSGNVVFVRFDDVSWVNSTITAQGAVIYNASEDNRVLRHIEFDGEYVSKNGPLEVYLPAPGVVCFAAAV